jgi:phosphinothricin acetyltransferase
MLTIRPMAEADAAEVLVIYKAGIDTGNATFETVAPSWEEFDARRMPAHRFVAEGDNGQVLGWIACIPFSWRQAYRGVVEHGVYIHPAAQGRGVGIALMRQLIASTEAEGIWTLQSGIFPENNASLALHRAAGFRQIGVRERVGCLGGVWRDVVLVERRSTVTGTTATALS